jgi:hypothetical protein
MKLANQYPRIWEVPIEPNEDLAMPDHLHRDFGWCQPEVIQTRRQHGLGPLQLKLLHALRRHGRETSLESLAAYAAGLIPDLATRPPHSPLPRRSTYVSVSRTVASLRRRGLVDTKVAGTANGRLEWPQNAPGAARPVWRFRHPGKRLIVRPVVDSLRPKS